MLALAIGISCFVGIIVALVAVEKGLSGPAWLVYGLIFPPIALVHVLLTGARAAEGDATSAMKVCPMCAEPIRAAAIRCRYCGADVSSIVPVVDDTSAADPADTGADEDSRRVDLIAAFVLVVIAAPLVWAIVR